MIRPRLAGIALVLVALIAGACSGSTASPSAAQAEPVALKVGLGYLASVQFAPFYRAEQAGYFDAAGLDVTFEHKIDPDLVLLVGARTLDLGIADGTSVIPAASRGIPITYVATIYRQFPSIVFAKTSSGIATAADLAGRKLGIPGRYGSSWVMLQALLDSAGLTPDDLDIVEYPDFGQAAALSQDAVDAATGFVNNEPVQLERTGEAVTILRVDDAVALPGPGIIAGEAILAERPDAVRAFVDAVVRAMADIEADPQVGLDATFAVVPELASDEAGQRAVLDATIATWRAAGGSELGAIDLDGWAASIAYMDELGLVPNPVEVADVVSTTFVTPRS